MTIDTEILMFIIVGFLAQLIDGALGMAYGVSSTSFLLSLGIPPASASAAVHIAEVFTTGVSGLSHLKFGNIDRSLLRKLIIPGVLGGITGAIILSSVPGKQMKPFVSSYLVIMGIVILIKAVRKREPKEVTTKLVPLGIVGGFLDAVGGGGWGPVVTSTLLARGHNARLTIGSVNASEFFVTLAEAATFIALLGITQFRVILGLMIGGVIAAPMAAYLCKRIPVKILMIIVGLLIIFLNIRVLLNLIN